jgi:NADPH2:quinone reductase
VGGDVFDACVRCIGGKGRLLVVGFASGRIPTLSVNMALIKGFSLVGVRAGAQLGAILLINLVSVTHGPCRPAAMDPPMARELSQQLAEWAAAGKLVPHVHCAVPVARAADAFTALCKRQAVGKTVVLMGEGPKAAL